MTHPCLFLPWFSEPVFTSSSVPYHLLSFHCLSPTNSWTFSCVSRINTEYSNWLIHLPSLFTVVHYIQCYKINRLRTQPDLCVYTPVSSSNIRILWSRQTYLNSFLAFWSGSQMVHHYTPLECLPLLYLPTGNQYPYFRSHIKAFPISIKNISLQQLSHYPHQTFDWSAWVA